VKAVGGTGPQADQVAKYARELWTAEAQLTDRRNHAVQMAFEALNQYAGNPKKKIKHTDERFHTGDHTQLPRFDEIASSVANEHPDLFHGTSERDHIEQLYEMMKEGTQPRPSIQPFQKKAYDEWVASNPQLKKEKPEFKAVKDSPLSEEGQRKIHDALPGSYLLGWTAPAHQAISMIEKAMKGINGNDAEALVNHLKGLKSEELHTARKALQIDYASSKESQMHAMLQKAGLGHYIKKDEPKDFPFSEGEAKPISIAIDAWLSIDDGTPEQLAKLLQAASDFEMEREEPYTFAEPAGRYIASTGTGKRADDRDAIHSLLCEAMSTGAKRLCDYVRRGLTTIGIDRAIRSGVLFTEKDRQALQDDLASAIATADLMGRARVRMKAEQVYKRHAQYFDERKATDQAPKNLGMLTPMEAYDYFTKLTPTLNVHPDRFGEMMERRAFTLAVATEKTLLEEVQRIIADAMSEGTPGGAVTIRQLLIETKTAPNNPQYAEAVYRTNIMDAAAVGHDREMNTPDMRETFPVFEYSAITGDGRGRPWHVAKNGLLYPSGFLFTNVRGTEPNDVINCRCQPIAIDKFELADRLARGEKIQERY